jgi:hypothetical protein
MTWASFEQLISELAARLGCPAAADPALAFLRSTGIALAPSWPNAGSDVAAGAFPIEFSFTRGRDSDLRLLAEPCRPGESLLPRIVAGVEAVDRSIAGLFGASAAAAARALVQNILPEDEEIPNLTWRSALWLAIRTNGTQSGIRTYVNAQFREPAERWRRMGRALSAGGFSEALSNFDRLRRATRDLVEPIGLCFDAGAAGVAPARVHCVTSKISPYWMLQLLSAVDQDEANADVGDFLDLLGILQLKGACPLLISFGLGSSPDLKIDVDLVSMQPDQKIRREGAYLARAEERFGRIDGHRAAAQMFAGLEPRYLGLTLERGSTAHLNVYFPCPQIASRRPQSVSVDAFAAARNLIVGEVRRGRGLRMDARSARVGRVPPSGWRDVYMTSLWLAECAVRSRTPVDDAVEIARGYLRDVREGWWWRYLPELPGDLDDTAMALVALHPADRVLDAEISRRLLECMNADGGFPTFIGGGPTHPQASHPAVTINVAFALDRAELKWSTEATDRYLRAWAEAPDFPACPWRASRILPLFLFARAKQLSARLGLRARLAARVLELQGPSGCWGGVLSDSLDTALAVVTLDLLEAPIPRSNEISRYLRETQLEDGGWGWSALYSDGEATFFGQRAITTAFALRALSVLGIE